MMVARLARRPTGGRRDARRSLQPRPEDDVTTINVPEVELPANVKDALAHFRTVEADHRRSVEAVREAEAAVSEAATLDRRALADRRTRGETGPPVREHRDAAERELEDANEVQDADTLRLDEARAALLGVMLDQSHRWQSRLGKAREKTERDLTSALGRIRDLVDERADLLAVDEFVENLGAAQSDGDYTRLLRRGLRRREATSDLRFGNGENIPISLLLDSLTLWAGGSTDDEVAAEVEMATTR